MLTMITALYGLPGTGYTQVDPHFRNILSARIIKSGTYRRQRRRHRYRRYGAASMAIRFHQEYLPKCLRKH